MTKEKFKTIYICILLIGAIALTVIISNQNRRIFRLEHEAKCTYEGLECPNAQAAMRQNSPDPMEYQFKLDNGGADIWDGDRFVGHLAFDSTSAFDKLMIQDNE